MAADGSIIIDTRIDDKKAQQGLNRLNRKIQTLNDQIYVKQQQKMPLVEQSKELGAQLDAAKAKLASLQSTSYGGVGKAEIQEQKEQVRLLQSEWNKVQGQVESYNNAISKASLELNLSKERAGAIQAQLATGSASGKKLANSMNQARKQASRFADNIGRAIGMSLMFSFAFRAVTAFTEWMGKVIKVNDEASEAVGRLKGALLTMVQPLFNVIIPAFTTFVNILSRIVTAISSVVSAMFGMTQEQAAKAAEELYKETEALNGVGNAAKDAEKSLASFDTINKLSENEQGRGAGAAASKGISPIFEDFNTEEYKRKIDELTAYVSGALLALGALLAFSGVNVPLGLALMAAGAIGLVSVLAENWGALDGPLQAAITRVLVILGTAALVIGAVLAFSGANLPLGIGLIAAGALAAAAAINWGSMDAEVRNTITGILEIVSGALLVLGAVFTFSGANIPLGIGLLVAGAVALAAAIALNWDGATTSIKQVVTDILLLVGTAFLVIGAVLIFSGANLPLGIGLMVAGAVGLASAAALNWETVQAALQGPIGAIIAAVSAALLVLGAVFVFTGTNLPLGIGLLIVGAVGLATTAVVNWETIQTAMQGPIGAVTAIVSGALLVLGVVLLFTGAGIPLGLGLIAVGAAGLVLAITPNWNFIQDAISGAWDSFVSWWDAGPAKFFTLDYWANLGEDILNGLLNGLKSVWSSVTNWVSEKVGWITGQFTDAKNSAPTINSSSTRMSAAISTKSIPALARGAVIPPNREFLAILGDQKSGTNIEAPASEIEAAVARGMQSGSGGYGGQLTITIKPASGLTRYLSYELDDESKRRGYKLVKA